MPENEAVRGSEGRCVMLEGTLREAERVLMLYQEKALEHGEISPELDTVLRLIRAVPPLTASQQPKPRGYDTCLCGHERQWHDVHGSCEHDEDCRCVAFRSPPVPSPQPERPQPDTDRQVEDEAMYAATANHHEEEIWLDGLRFGKSSLLAQRQRADEAEREWDALKLIVRSRKQIGVNSLKKRRRAAEARAEQAESRVKELAKVVEDQSAALRDDRNAKSVLGWQRAVQAEAKVQKLEGERDELGRALHELNAACDKVVEIEFAHNSDATVYAEARAAARPLLAGDGWRCECGDLNIAHEIFCYRCGAGKPES